MKNLAPGLACKCSGFRATPDQVGFVLSKAEMQKFEDVRKTLAETSKSVQSGSRVVAVGLGAVAMGLGWAALSYQMGRGKK